MMGGLLIGVVEELDGSVAEDVLEELGGQVGAGLGLESVVDDSWSDDSLDDVHAGLLEAEPGLLALLLDDLGHDGSKHSRPLGVSGRNHEFFRLISWEDDEEGLVGGGEALAADLVDIFGVELFDDSGWLGGLDLAGERFNLHVSQLDRESFVKGSKELSGHGFLDSHDFAVSCGLSELQNVVQFAVDFLFRLVLFDVLLDHGLDLFFFGHWLLAEAESTSCAGLEGSEGGEGQESAEDGELDDLLHYNNMPRSIENRAIN